LGRFAFLGFFLCRGLACGGKKNKKNEQSAENTANLLHQFPRKYQNLIPANTISASWRGSIFECAEICLPSRPLVLWLNLRLTTDYLRLLPESGEHWV
jgi:hypothetical protein